MADTPELDQVTEARRKLAAHAGYPRTYWVLLGIVLVLFAGLPIWTSFLPGEDRTYLSWVLLAVALASAAYAIVRRRRSGVYLPRRIGAYPTAFKFWLTGLVVSIGGFVGITQLVAHDQRAIALGVLVPVAIAVFALQVATQSAMRADIEAGRVAP